MATKKTKKKNKLQEHSLKHEPIDPSSETIFLYGLRHDVDL